MLVTMIAPEILLAKAFNEFMVSKDQNKHLEVLATHDGVPWTITHTLFANMGGFVLRSIPASDRETPERWDLENQGRTRPEIALDTLHSSPGNGEMRLETSSDYAESNGHEAMVTQTQSNPQSEEEPFLPADVFGLEKLEYPDLIPVTASMILDLRFLEVLKLPSVTTAEIEDKSKGDIFVRAIAVAQIAWILVQVIARASRGLAISQLEITAVAFSACAITIYILNWRRPKGVKVPCTLFQYPGNIPIRVIRILQKSHMREERLLSDLIWLWPKVSPTIVAPRIPNEALLDSKGNWMYLWGVTIGSIIFNGLHNAAWNFIFPTKVEQILWRAASFWCTIFLFIRGAVVLLVFLLLTSTGLDRHINSFRTFFTPTERVLLALYSLARLFLMAETFRSLLFLPPDAYVATWASNIPHVA
jgi:hypothetical protein